MQKLVATAFVLFAAMASALAQPAPSPDALKDAALKDLAPTGKLRAAINFGNGVLAQKGPNGEPRGITPDLATALAKRLGVPVEFVRYEAAGKVFDGAPNNEWDIGFIAIEPVRANVIEFSPPYVIIEGTYMVRKDSPLREVDDVDKPGIKISVGLKSAYDLYLTRSLKHATLVRAAVGGGAAGIELFVRDKLDATAGVRQPLEIFARDHPEMRVMAGHFQEIRQAMGTPKGRLAGAAYLKAFIEEMKANGFVADALQRSGQVAVVVPPVK